MRWCTSISLLLCTLLLASISSAQQTSATSVPNLIRYSGTLKDANGAPVAATTGVTFSIYKEQDGGTPVWMETQNVTTDAGGNYSVLLGSTTATGLPSDLFSQEEQRWLGVQVQGQAEHPRVLLVSVPYALKAHEAETLAGKSVSDFVLAKGTKPVNGSSPSQSATLTASANPASNGARRGATSDGPTNFSGSTTDQIVGVTQTGTGAGVNATAPTNAVVGTATAPNGYGLYGIATSSNAIAVKGITYVDCWWCSGTAVRGANAAVSGHTTGVSAFVASPSGTAAVFNNAGGGQVISGQNNGDEVFGVYPGILSAYGYQIGGATVLRAGDPGDDADLFLGVQAGFNSRTGYDGGLSDVFSGYQAGFYNITGHNNTFNGYLAGYNATGSNDIYIANMGCPYPCTENNTIRIGGDVGMGPQTANYIAGIYNSTATPTPPYQAVCVDLNGTLFGTTPGSSCVVSSLRFKEQIADMGDSSSRLFQLRPATFFYRPQYDDGSHLLQYGLIAEEVAKVYPDMVAYDKDGQPYAVKYQLLAPMLLNELQKQHTVVAAQEKQFKEMENLLSRLEAVIGIPGKASSRH